MSERRITGTEMEWPASHYDPETRKVGPHISPQLLMPFIKSYAKKNDLITGLIPNNSNLYLNNGCRLYTDIGEKLEYSTPEDDEIIGAVASEIAGERIIYAAMQKMIEGNAVVKDARMHRRVIDRGGLTWGYHQSLLASIAEYRANKSADQPDELITAGGLAVLGLHMVTYNILCGAGTIRPDGEHCIAQKALDIKDDFSLSTTRNKPVINLRNEALGDDSKYRRVHVTSGDKNTLAWAMRMSNGTKELVVSLIEHGYTMPNVRFSDPLHSVMQAVARDTQLANGYLLENGDRVRAIDVQRELVEASKSLDGSIDLSEEQQWTLEEWEKSLADLEQDPNLLKEKVDWVTKLDIVKNYAEKHGCARDDPRLQLADLSYDESGPNSLGTKLLQQDVAGSYMPPEELILDRMKNPPQTTRAYLRSETLRKHSEVVSIAGWESVTVKGHAIKLKDPLATTNQELSEAIAEAEADRANLKF